MSEIFTDYLIEIKSSPFITQLRHDCMLTLITWMQATEHFHENSVFRSKKNTSKLNFTNIEIFEAKLKKNIFSSFLKYNHLTALKYKQMEQQFFI